MGSSSVSGSTTLRRGFGAEDVQNFLRRGSTLAGEGGLSRGESIRSIRPQEQTLVSTTSRARLSAGPFSTVSSPITRVAGFRGELSNVSAEQLDAITNSFLLRQRQIQQRRAQPGRQSLFLARSS